MAIFYMLIGLPGSGKTTFTNTVEADIYSSDAIRKELWGDEAIQKAPYIVFNLMKERSIKSLKKGKDVVYDATNLTRKNRVSTLNYIKNAVKNVKFVAVIIATSIELCVERDSKRDRVVGKDVILRMVKTFEVPTVKEGFSEIRIIKDKGNLPLNKVMDLNKIPHDNPYHSKDVYNHMVAVAAIVMGFDNASFNLKIAALLHDIGKVYTKTFDENNVAHYYGHANVGAYVYLCCADKRTEDALYIAGLILHHMDLFNTNLSIEKYRRKVGRRMYNDLVLLHKADVAADSN